MSVTLPPSARDFLIYERLLIDAASTRTIAAELGLSQTRIRQIALRVTRWLVETLPTADADLSDEAKLRLSQHIAADRLARLYFTTNRAWQETTQVKFANLLIRIMTAQSKLPVIPGTLEALAADAILGPLPDDTSSLYTTKDSPASNTKSEIGAPAAAGHLKSEIPLAPPVRACSPPPQNSPAPEQKPTTAPAANPTAPKPYDNLQPTTRSARAAFLSPAHLSEKTDPAPILEPSVVRGSPDPAPSILELKITPEKLGFTAQKNLSRKDRRRLRRLAMSK